MIQLAALSLQNLVRLFVAAALAVHGLKNQVELDQVLSEELDLNWVVSQNLKLQSVWHQVMARISLNSKYVPRPSKNLREKASSPRPRS